MKLTCEQLAGIISAEGGFDKDLVYSVLNAAVRVAGNLLIEGHSVGWWRLGVLKPVVRAPRVVRNPRTKELDRVPEQRGIRFVVSKDLLRKIR